MTSYLCPNEGCLQPLQATQKVYWSLGEDGTLEQSPASDFDWDIYCADDHNHGSFIGDEDALAEHMRSLGVAIFPAKQKG